jgi:branched-chain amino acid transport system substrate-binding protein
MLYRHLIAALAAACIVLAGASEAWASRVALVIGNSAYASVARLSNPENDARAIAQTLRSLDFTTVEVVLNQSGNELRQAIHKFSYVASTADIAFVFYAGHGIEVGGNNYLIPVDARLRRDADVEFETISLDLVMRAIESAKLLRVVFLDACRDNPFLNQMQRAQGSTRSIGRGLARVDPPGDKHGSTFIAYAAKAGTIATDGTGRNSPFTTALLQHIGAPGTDFYRVLGKVRDTVLDLTNRQQEPFVYSSLGGQEVHLRPATGAAPPIQSTAPAFDPRALELAYWESVRNSTSAAEIRSYLDRYPDGTFANLARARIRELENRVANVPPPATPPPAVVTPPLVLPGAGTIRFGVAGPLTGPNAAFGAQLKNGTELAVQDINAAGGILGRKIVLNYGDDVSDPKQGVSVANKFAGDGVKFVVGHFNSGVTMPASDVYQQNGIVAVTPSATNPRITERGLWNIFRTSGRDDQQGAIAAQYILSKYRGRKIAIVHDKTTYGQGLADETKKHLNGGGMREVLYEGVNLGDKNFSALVSKIKAGNADLVYWGGLHMEGGLIVRQMREQGVRAVLMSGDGITSDEFASVGGPGVEGTLMTFAPDPRRRAEAKRVVERFRAMKFEPEAYTLYSYAAVEILKQAAEAAQSLEPRKVAEVMRSGRKFKTVIGDIGYDRKGDITRPDYVMYVWKKSSSGSFTYTELDNRF